MLKNYLRVLTTFFLLVMGYGLIGVGAAAADEIIDNGDPGTSSTGTWAVSGGPDPYDPADPDATSLWSRDGSTYTWTFTPTEAGAHEIRMWWTAYASRANSIPVTIEHAAGTETVTVNQQTGGGQWNSLGTYTFAAGVSYDVTITAVPGGTANYSTCADAVQAVYRPDLNAPPTAVIDAVSPSPALTTDLVTFTGHGEDLDGTISAYSWHSSIVGYLGDTADLTLTTPLPEGVHTITFTVTDDQEAVSEPATQSLVVGEVASGTVIDNGDPGTSFTGTWTPSGAAGAYDPMDPDAVSLWSRNGSTYTWTFTPSTTGEYELSMWWTVYASRSPSVPVSVEFLDGTDSVTINQLQNGGQWNGIGTYPLVQGQSYDVTVTAVPGGTQNYSTCADAVRFVKVGSINEPPRAAIDAVVPLAATPGEFIDFQGTGADGDGTVAAYEWRSDLDGVIGNQPSLTSDELSPGTHTIFFRVQDDQGLWSQPATTLVVVRDCATPVSIMPLGNSITYGVGEISDQNLITGYREPLFRLLANAGYHFDFVGSRSTGLYVAPPFDIQHQGMPGITDTEVAAGVYNWLAAYPAEIVLLHIGTNYLTPDPGDVETILDEIDRYEADNNVDVTVVLARIINREIYHPETTLFNDNVAAMAEARIAQGDKILRVDMESALNYAVDMWDNLHPFNAGYVKMAGEWMGVLSRLMPICPEFPPFIYSHPVTTATVGLEYSYLVGALGNPAPGFSLTEFPAGMAIDPVTGEITWVPSPAQTGVRVTVEAANAMGSSVQSFNVDTTGAIIIDNGDPGTSFTGTWAISGGTNPYDPDDPDAVSLWSRDGSTYTWTFTPQLSGTYDISMWWTAYASRGSSIPVTIENDGQAATVYVNQQTGGGQWNSLGVYTFSAGVSYDVTITAVPGGSANYSTCADAVKMAVASPSTAPAITTQPVSQSVAEGSTASFSVTATGTAPLGYQWQKNGADIPGATGSGYTTPAVTLSDHNAQFRCVVSNDAGSATSNAATLTVTSSSGDTVHRINGGGPAVTSSGVAWSGDLYYTGSTSTYRAAKAIAGTVDDVLYQTERYGRTMGYSLPVAPGTYAVDLHFAEIYFTTSGSRVFDVDVENGQGGLNDIDIVAEAGSNTALVKRFNEILVTDGYLNIQFSASVDNAKISAIEVRAVSGGTPAAPAITTQPVSQSVAVGSTASFSVTATGTAPLGYQWQKNGADIPGATGSGYTTPAVTLSDHNAQFRCVVSNDAGSATSDAATLTVTSSSTAPAITTQPVSQSVAEGSTASFSVTATGTAPLGYQWQKNGADIPGATGSGYTTPAVTLSDHNAQFRCVVSNDAGSATSNAATLTVTTGTSGAPTAFNDRADTEQDRPVVINVIANDTDPDGTINPAGVTVTTGPTYGTAAAQTDGTVRYTPDPGYSGKDAFSYTVRDNSGMTSNAAAVTVTVGIVIDNGDPQTAYTGTWGVSSGADPYDPADPQATSVWSRNGDTYTWTFTPTVSGNYEVSMWHTYSSSRGDNIPVEIENWNQSATIFVNQQVKPGQWNLLGTYPFEAGVSYDITIISQPYPTSTCADAVRFVMIPSNVAPRAVINDISPTTVLPGETVTFSGSGADFEDGVAAYSWYSTLDGPLSDQATFSTSSLSEGVHTIFFKVQDHSGAWSPEIQSTVDVNNSQVQTTEHIYFAFGYATFDGLPLMTATLQDLGATFSNGVWTYVNMARNKRFIVHPVTTAAQLVDALKTPDAHVLYHGHSNYGLGQLFATDAEFSSQVIDNIRYVDDDRILNTSSPIVHVNVSGMRTGQAYPHWWPIYKDGTSAIVPYEKGDPNGDPAYNYYPTYQIPGDPTHYRIETVKNSAIERFPDWSGPAWYDPDGDVPDPDNPSHDIYYITNPEPWSPSFERVGNWVDTNTLLDFFRENYEYSSAGSGADTARWMFSIPEAADYNVYVWYPAASGNASNAPFTVNHADGSTVVAVNQRLNGGQWNRIGTFRFGVDDYSVVLGDNANGNVVADGVRIEHTDNPPEVLSADFYAVNRSGPAPLDVYFDSESVGDIDTFEWDFGDGGINTTRSTVTHTYTQPGTYTVTYTIRGPLGSDTTTKVGYVTVGAPEPPLQADFESRTSQQGTIPFTASFRDRSSGNIVSWSWDFDGDGAEDSTVQSPSFTYTTPGNYTVTLTVENENGESVTEIKEAYVRIGIYDANIDNVDYPKRHYGSKTLLKRKTLEVPKEDLEYARLFYAGCDTATYYTDTFQRGILFYANNSSALGNDAMAAYLRAYVNGASDYEIWQIIQEIEPLYDYYDFTKPPSEQW